MPNPFQDLPACIVLASMYLVARVFSSRASVVVWRMRGMRIGLTQLPLLDQQARATPRQQKQICENWPLITTTQANNTPHCSTLHDKPEHVLYMCNNVYVLKI